MTNFQIEEVNAIIKSTKISSEEGLLEIWLDLDYGGSGQGFGGYALYLPKSFPNHKINAGFAGHFIWRCMEIAGVTNWDDLIGKTVRVRKEHSKIHAIGHIIKNDWFSPYEDFKRDQAMERRK